MQLLADLKDEPGERDRLLHSVKMDLFLWQILAAEPPNITFCELFNSRILPSVQAPENNQCELEKVFVGTNQRSRTYVRAHSVYK